MARNSLPVPVPERRPLSRLLGFVRSLSPKTLVVVLVAVILLFRWLHLVLALDIAATGRRIQLVTQQQQKHEWKIDQLEKLIAEAESPRTLAVVVEQLGLEPGRPEFVPRAEGEGPVLQVPGVDRSGGTDRGRTAVSPPSIFESISAFLTGSASVTVAP